MDINLWLAEQCDIEIENSLVFKIPDRGDGLPKYFHYEWNYKDPRCREIIREHFGICTEPYNDAASQWTCVSSLVADIQEWADSIAEAECACIEAIYATEDR